MATPDKLAAWKKLGEPQPITLPSGTQVKIVVPDLPELLRAGEVPNALVQYAADTEQALKGVEDLDMEKVREATDFMRWMISTTVKSPAITPEDVPALPPLDRDMILEFAMRQRDIDAVGHHLHGLEKLNDWRRFRRGGAID